MSFHQLNPPLPVTAVEKGKGIAHAVIDYGPEHNLLWVTALDETGEIWCVPNPQIRMQRNWSMGRNISKDEMVKPSSSAIPISDQDVA